MAKTARIHRIKMSEALVRSILSKQKAERILQHQDEYLIIDVDQRVAYDVLNIAYGIYSPLDHLMDTEEILYVAKKVELPSGAVFSLPIFLDVREEDAERIREEDIILLRYNGKTFAMIVAPEVEQLSNKAIIAEKIFKTRDLEHPGVRYLYQSDPMIVSGKVILLQDVDRGSLLSDPLITRAIFKAYGWRTIAGFQTRNVPHIGHETIIRTALEQVDAVFINPVIGRKKRGDWTDEAIVKPWWTLINNYLPRDRTYFALLRYVMRYAGPREALHHAIMRKNLGCTHFIIGRDHAGVGSYYKPYEAQEFVKQYADQIGIEIIEMREFFYCKKCRMIVSDRTCPHSDSDRIRFSGTLIRRMLVERKQPDEHIFRKEIYEVVSRLKNPFIE